MSRVRPTEVEGTYLRKGNYLRGLIWEVGEGLTDLGERILPGPGVPEEKVLTGRAAPTEGREAQRGTGGAYLGEARGLGELGAHVSLVHANQGSVQLLSSFQVIF